MISDDNITEKLEYNLKILWKKQFVELDIHFDSRSMILCYLFMIMYGRFYILTLTSKSVLVFRHYEPDFDDQSSIMTYQELT